MDEKKYCCYCGRWLVFPLRLTKEHILPVSKGGKNTADNIRYCCHLCNTWRGNKDLSEFKKDVARVIETGIYHKNAYRPEDFQKMLVNITLITPHYEMLKENVYFGKKLFNESHLKAAYIKGFQDARRNEAYTYLHWENLPEFLKTL